MKYIISSKKKARNKKEKTVSGIFLVFFLCLGSLMLFFVGEVEENKEVKGEEIISTFENSTLYEFLDLDMAKEQKTQRQVSDLSEKS